jgi:hypothetical protein
MLHAAHRPRRRKVAGCAGTIPHAVGWRQVWLADLSASGVGTRAASRRGGGDDSIPAEWFRRRPALRLDRTSWWNSTAGARATEPLCPMEAEFGRLQGFGMSSYGFASAERIVCAYVVNGVAPNSTPAPAHWMRSRLSPISALRVAWRVFSGGSPLEPMSLVMLDWKAGADGLAPRQRIADREHLSARARSVPTSGGRRARLLTRRAAPASAPEGELCRCVRRTIRPTGATTTTLTLDPSVTAAAVLDVNCGKPAPAMGPRTGAG